MSLHLYLEPQHHVRHVLAGGNVKGTVEESNTKDSRCPQAPNGKYMAQNEPTRTHLLSSQDSHNTPVSVVEPQSAPPPRSTAPSVGKAPTHSQELQVRIGVLQGPYYIYTSDC